ncbi:MAG: sugar transferase [Candidatus Kerfeldbacteria bacterium]|nr:sugar transferase [Candidatus Kerfeldbacteria bacterium]
MKRVELFFGGLLVPLDYLMLLLAGWLAYIIRFDESVVGLKGVIYELPLADYMRVLAASSLGLLVIFAWNGLYDITGTRRIVDELRRIFVACSTGVMIVIVLVFFDRTLFSSRFIILLTWVLSIALIATMRFVVIQIERALFRQGIGVRRVLLIGKNRTADTLAEAINTNPEFGMSVVERVAQIDQNFFSKLPKVLDLKHIDEVLLADPTLTRLHISTIIELCKIHHTDFKYAADIFDAQISHVASRPLAGIPIVELRRTPLQGWGNIYKRLLDVVGALLALIILGPIMLLAAVAVRLESPGPVIYRNRRVGQNGKLFNTLKFRSMHQQYCIGDQFTNSDAALQYEQQLIEQKSIKSGPVYKIKDDPRVTKVGAFLRRTSIDELPQFFNVLLNHMSLVGPRPHQPREVNQYEDHQRTVLSMKPGITGLAQISGRSDLEFEEEVRLDKYYMENWNSVLDLYILFKTPMVLLRRRQAW